MPGAAAPGELHLEEMIGYSRKFNHKGKGKVKGSV